MNARIGLAAVAVALAACGSNRHCIGDFPYQRAATLAPPAPVEGLRTPTSVSAMVIPPPPAESVPFAREVADPDDPGRTRVQCLDIPPPLIETPPPDEPATDS
ncbi:hypothetical protein [Sinimarinibacterium thermocellulolyticum]|uniref:Lipoprotein n=1 Tax=Sinimarinibacterium thermocellulolyticum TaxID=3170016 RepID=A0ABV2A7X4_9GAMM